MSDPVGKSDSLGRCQVRSKHEPKVKGFFGDLGLASCLFREAWKLVEKGLLD